MRQPAAVSKTRPRWPYAGPAQKTLLLASLVVVVGAFLPWVHTPVGNFTGMGGPGSWTVFAGVIGAGASLMRSRMLVTAHAAVIAAVCVALPVWQLSHMLALVGLTAWLPGIGLVATLGAGLVIGRAALRMRPAHQPG